MVLHVRRDGDSDDGSVLSMVAGESSHGGVLPVVVLVVGLAVRLAVVLAVVWLDETEDESRVSAEKCDDVWVVIWCQWECLSRRPPPFFFAVIVDGGTC